MGPSGVRYQTGKLNMKAAGYGAAVEWHQDWAFYPHTNDDLLAIGIYLDDCGPDNGPLMVIPGSHRWPISDHHSEGVFCGAIDPTTRRHRLLEGRDADRQGRQHDHPPRPHGPRLGAEHLRPAPAPAAVPVHRGRRLPAHGHSGLGEVQRLHRHRRADHGAAADPGARAHPPPRRAVRRGRSTRTSARWATGTSTSSTTSRKSRSRRLAPRDPGERRAGSAAQGCREPARRHVVYFSVHTL